MQTTLALATLISSSICSTMIAADFPILISSMRQKASSSFVIPRVLKPVSDTR
jgi:hypothetical protein